MHAAVDFKIIEQMPKQRAATPSQRAPIPKQRA
jgi:hypothetical protein